MIPYMSVHILFISLFVIDLSEMKKKTFDVETVNGLYI